MGMHRRTHCRRGHELTPENSKWSKNGQERQCRICFNTAHKNYTNNSRYGMDTIEAEIFRSKSCEICGKLAEKMVIDHCHSTNKVRGTLCYGCNIFLGHVKENEQILYKAIEYLRSHRPKVEASYSVCPKVHSYM